jgi:hypothetical protein
MQKRYLCSKHRDLLIYPCQFRGGVYVTQDKTEQALIEGSMTFLEGVIAAHEELPPNTVEIEIPGEATPPASPLSEEAAEKPKANVTKYLSQLNRAELLAIAKKNGIEGTAEMTRREIYFAIKEVADSAGIPAGL